jgi:hypothetical protein
LQATSSQFWSSYLLCKYYTFIVAKAFLYHRCKIKASFSHTRYAYSKTFWRIVKSGSTEEFEAAPYVFTLLNALLWLYYGLTKPDGLLIATVNGFGAVMEAIYVLLFIVYAADRATRVRAASKQQLTCTGVINNFTICTTFLSRVKLFLLHSCILLLSKYVLLLLFMTLFYSIQPYCYLYYYIVVESLIVLFLARSTAYYY